LVREIVDMEMTVKWLS